MTSDMTTEKQRPGKQQLPALALRQVVIFPGISIPLAAGRPHTLKAIEAAVRQDNLVFATLQRQDISDIDPTELHTIGTIARIEQVQRGLGGVQLVVTGLRRGIALRVDERDEYYVATVADAEELKPTDPNDLAFEALVREVRARAAELGEKAGMPKEVAEQVVRSVDDPGRLADLVAGYIDIKSSDRQTLLETLSVEDRLRRVLTHVERQIGVLDAQADIKSQVQEELGDRQREIILREQLKAIQKELGHDQEANESEELRAKVEALQLPEGVFKEVNRELTRLERMGRESMESQVIRTFIETVIELPWTQRTEDHLDLQEAARVLDEDHYGLGDIKDRVLEFLAVRRLHQRHEEAEPSAPEAGEVAASTSVTTEATDAATEPVQPTTEDAPRLGSRRGPILLFVGPPGVGKTSLARSIARAMGREYVRVSLGGARDEADIRGHRRTYVAAMPGRIIQGLRQAGTKNPVFLLDEIDKLGASFHGDPSAALLEVLDPAQNSSFTDHYLGLPFDLSEVLFVATANFLQNIPEPLLDRMEIVQFSGYTEDEKLGIAKQYLLPRQRTEAGLELEELEITEDALRALIQRYTREAGVRQLEREIGRVARKVARQVAEREVKPEAETEVRVGAEEIGKLLGRPKVHPEHKLTEDEIGVATGLYYTPVGGDIMFVEATATKGKGNLTLTGQLGDVMQESARAAWSYAKAHAEALHINPEAFENRDIHVHVPAGAIPKDGPSAGITMATALISALARRPVRHDIAMTGELTLRGRVLPIGGVKEKVLGAVRAGIETIVLPAENLHDLEDLAEDVRRRLVVHTANELGEVLAVALRDASFAEGRLLFAGDDPATIQPLSRSFH